MIILSITSTSWCNTYIRIRFSLETKTTRTFSANFSRPKRVLHAIIYVPTYSRAHALHATVIYGYTIVYYL